MKSNVFRYVAVITGSLAVISVCAVLLVVLQPDDELPVDTGISTSKPEMDGQTFEDWSEEYLNLRASRLAEEEARKSTTARHTTTTTTKRTWQTVPATPVTVPSKSTTSSIKRTETTSATQRVSKTTRLATKEEKEEIYRSVSAESKEIYEGYKAEMLALIAEVDAEIIKLQAQKKDIDEQYEKDEDELYERLKHEFFPISIYLDQLTNEYRSKTIPIDNKISELKALKESIQSDLEEAENQLDGIIQEKYKAAVEEFQQKTLS